MTPRVLIGPLEETGQQHRGMERLIGGASFMVHHACALTEFPCYQGVAGPAGDQQQVGLANRLHNCADLLRATSDNAAAKLLNRESHDKDQWVWATAIDTAGFPRSALPIPWPRSIASPNPLFQRDAVERRSPDELKRRMHWLVDDD